MLKIQEIKIPGYEIVIKGTDPQRGLIAYIAVHSTRLGPAMGGTRLFPYADETAALEDALRLAKAMTYKSALAETGLGGGKAVIIVDPKKGKTEELLLAYGELVNSLKGKFIAAEDVGSTPEDMAIVRRKTPYVGALQTETSSGDPSRFTAWGVHCGIIAVAEKLWGHGDLRGKTVAIQGLGNVGSKLADILFWEGVHLIVCDKDPAVAHKCALLYGADVIDPNDYISTPCDILAPCALGGIINEATIPKLHCKAIAGAANNQLKEPKNGLELMRKNILYAPDYVINAGGIINAANEINKKYDPRRALSQVNHIYDTTKAIIEKAEQEHKPTSQVADELAEYKLQHSLEKAKPVEV